jgi:hypothetical protein
MPKPDAVARPGPGAVTVAVPFCLMALVVVADVLAGPQIGLLPLLSLGPALAPVSLGPARTVLTGGLAIALGRLYDDVLGHVGGHLHDDSAALLVVRSSP